MNNSSHLLFQYYLKQIVGLFQKAISQSNPAQFLYSNNTRELLFRTEALVRLVNRLVEDKEVKRSLKTLKKLEDTLGRIGEYEDYITTFSKNKKINHAQIDYFREKRDALMNKLNERLIKKAYYQNIFHDIIVEFTINFNDRQLILKLRELIKTELEKCHTFFLKYKTGFSDAEDVHELRRKLRWFSIYAMAFRGIIVLKEVPAKYAWEKKLITAEETRSPFNKPEVKKDLVEHIFFNKKAFLALSHVTRELGKIKELSFAIRALERSLKKTGTKENGEKLAIKQSGSGENEEALLKKAHDHAEAFFSEYKIHEVLIL